MNRKNWSPRLVIRYSLFQIPGIVLVTASLVLFRYWLEYPAWVTWAGTALWIVKDVILFPVTWRAYDWEQKSGTAHALVGLRGVAKQRLSPTGYVQVRGERWQAKLAGNIAAIDRGVAIRVSGVRGLTLLVEPDDQSQVEHLHISSDRSNRPAAPDIYLIPTLVVSYFPLKRDRIDQAVTGDVAAPLQQIRHHTRQTTGQVVQALEEGSRYHGYKDPAAQPSLQYQIVDTIEFLEPLPTRSKRGHQVPMTDYNAIMHRIDIQHWVEQRGIKEVWLWGYHGGVIDIWESNMAGPYGDISNSDRDPTDLPVLSKTYTVYHYNYGRGPSEAVEDHMHQIEAVLKHIDFDLFWNKFVGRPGEGRCGWAHYPPNGVRDYDWANPGHILTDIEDWRPDGGPKKRLNYSRWKGDSLTWFIYWMQNLPGANNDIIYRGRPLTNWWAFIGDFDAAMAQGLGLVE